MLFLIQTSSILVFLLDANENTASFKAFKTRFIDRAHTLYRATIMLLVLSTFSAPTCRIAD